MEYFKKVGKFFRTIFTFWIKKYDLNHLHTLRFQEFKYIVSFFPKPPKSVLELGAGTGWQSKLLSENNYLVKAIDLPTSNYKNRRVWDIIDYDGTTIPFDNHTFDIVFSSNVMEHILNTQEIQNEIFRVLKDDGILIHVMPTPTWRILTNITHFFKFWNMATVHGVHSNSLSDEKLFFSKRNWTKILNDNNFNVTKVFNIPLLYSGNSIFGSRLNLTLRKYFAKLFGGSCDIYILKKK